jgi:glycerophosphoryl diester phosphodiesterase
MIRVVSRLKGWAVELMRGCPRLRRSGRKWNDRDVLIIAHRGAGTHAPENTIPAFQRALDVDRCTAIEIDLSLTADGEVVLWHDWDPDTNVAMARQAALEGAVGFRPMAPGIGSTFRRPVDRLTLAELREHYGYGTKEPIAERVADVRIPTFEEFVEWAVRRPELRFVMFDIKVPAAVPECVEPMMKRMETILHRHSTPFEYVFSTPCLPVLQEMLRVASHPDLALDVEPPIGLVLRPGRFSSVASAIEMGIAYGTSVAPMAWTIAPWTTYRRIIHQDVKRRDRHNARKPNVPIKRVFAATINDKTQMTCLIGLGIDGIITDRPALVREAAERVGRRVC